MLVAVVKRKVVPRQLDRPGVRRQARQSWLRYLPHNCSMRSCFTALQPHSYPQSHMDVPMHQSLFAYVVMLSAKMGVLVTGRECLDVNARAGMIADAATIQELLYEVLPPVLKGGSGASVAALARPWPTLEDPSGGTGLWWDK